MNPILDDLTVPERMEIDRMVRTVGSLPAGVTDDQLWIAGRRLLMRGDQDSIRESVIIAEARRVANLETPAAMTAWTRLLDICRDQFRIHAVRMWIEPVRPAQLGDRLALIGHPIRLSWLNRRYLPTMKTWLLEQDDHPFIDLVACDETRKPPEGILPPYNGRSKVAA